MRTKLFKMLALLTVALMLLPAVAGAQVQTVPAGYSDEAAQEEPDAQEALGDLDVSVAPQTGKVRFLRLSPDQSAVVARQLGTQLTAEDKAVAFLEAYGALFGVRDAGAELKLGRSRVDQLGYTHLSYDQVYQGVPVFAGVLRVHFNAAGLITAVNGLFIPDLAVSTTPALSAEEAAVIAEARVNGMELAATLAATVRGGDAAAVNTTLYVFRENLARGLPGANHLAYEVEVSNGRDVREFVYVDAHSGKVVDQITGIYEALDRNVYNQEYHPSALVWNEGDPLPFTGSAEITRTELISDVNNVLNYTEDTYNMVAAASDGTYLSYDGADATMELVVDTTLINCPNAMWNGTFAQFCEQVTGDDTVAHEWGHGYEAGTNNLMYFWQSGALSESYADIFGEVVDLINGEGLDSPGGLRSDGACSIYTSWPPKLTVTAPPSIAGDYAAGFAQFGPSVDGTLTGTLMIVDDGTASPTEGCNPLVNDLTGHIAFIRRGTCAFTIKVKNAQDAGAIGAVIANHEAGGDGTITMSGDDPTITIQSVFIGYSDGNTIEAEIPGGVDVEFNLDTVGAEPDDSYRWLSGEDDPAFGGAIRDMWMPSCYGDPDNVTSDDYMCGTDDNGGVHTNSGVPNHAFALAVDGGNFNGQSITGIGLTKAFHIYWRSQVEYQTPTSDFPDHADALEQSCQDLQEAGTDLLDLVTGAPSGQVISVADCAELAKAILAVELRTYPDQCDFQPLLAKDPPSYCATPTEPFFIEQFGSDPGATWTLTNTGVYAEYVERNWMWVDSMPDLGQGGFYAEDPYLLGDCVPGSDDQSGVVYLDSPTMTVPAGGVDDRAVVVFDHYLATEMAYDGGNVWISVNGGEWQLLAAGDFEFNGYNGTLAAAPGNTNPLAGLAAFFGTDAGGLSGSWGQSQVDVSGYADTGDEIQLRFALGIDGCNGIDGWYLDQVGAYFCKEPVAVVSVDPVSLYSQQPGMVQVTEVVTVSNLGDANLQWSVFDGLLVDRAGLDTGNPWWSIFLSDYGVGSYPTDQFTLDQETVITGLFAGGNTDWNPPGLAGVTDINWFIYADSGGVPAGYPSDGGGTETWSLTALPTDPGVDITDENIALDLVAAGESLVLPAGTYWLMVLPTTTVSLPWWEWYEAEGSSALLGNQDEFWIAPADWLAIGVSLDFSVWGIPADLADCTWPSVTGWLDVDPMNGVVEYGVAGDLVDVTFDSTGLGPAVYTGAVCIETNDPVTPLVEVPVTLEVTTGVYLPIVFRN